jgi:integrase
MEKIEQYPASRRNSGKNNLKNVTLNKELSTIGVMFQKAVDWRFIKTSPAGNVRELPDDGVKHDRYLRPLEIKQLLQAAVKRTEELKRLPAQIRKYRYWAEFITIALNTGLRLSELTNLEFSDIDFDLEELTVKKKPHLHFL